MWLDSATVWSITLIICKYIQGTALVCLFCERMRKLTWSLASWDKAVTCPKYISRIKNVWWICIRSTLLATFIVKKNNENRAFRLRAECGIRIFYYITIFWEKNKLKGSQSFSRYSSEFNNLYRLIIYINTFKINIKTKNKIYDRVIWLDQLSSMFFSYSSVCLSAWRHKLK